MNPDIVVNPSETRVSKSVVGLEGQVMNPDVD